MNDLRRRRIAPPLLCLALASGVMACHRGTPERAVGARADGPDDAMLRQTFGDDFAKAAAARPTDRPLPVPPPGSAVVNAQAEPVLLDRH